MLASWLKRSSRPVPPPFAVRLYHAHSRPNPRGANAIRIPGAADLFHGARITDVKSTVQALRRSLPEGTPLAMVGYSMGGIIAMNYASIAGADSGVSCCVSMSGSFDVR